MADRAESSTPRRRRRGTREGAEGIVIPPPEILNVEVTLAPRPEGLGVISAVERPSTDNIDRFKMPSGTLYAVMQALAARGFEVVAVGKTSISVRCPVETYQNLFATELATFSQVVHPEGMVVQAFLFPPEGARWQLPPELSAVIEDAYIQWPPIYFQGAIPPPIANYHHLRVPGDISLVLNADAVHRSGTTGKGVKVAMVDSGFFTGHPYFHARGYNMAVILAPGATHSDRDGDGHGTAECANVLAVAPDVTFIGVKLQNENNPNQSASLAAGFKIAVQQQPDIITVSIGFDLVQPSTRIPLAQLPNSLKPLEAEIKAAVQAGIIVIFAAGNGQVAFPGMLPEVISAGGTFVDANLNLQASDYASAFDSGIYPGRHVPDVTGLVGLTAQGGAYITLPVAANCTTDQFAASNRTPAGNPKFADGTAPNDGWAVISGTSAAAPQLAGVCALLKQKNPGLTPQNAVNILKRTARDVVNGQANPASNNGVALQAGPGPDGATGHGLVDAFEAWKQV